MVRKENYPNAYKEVYVILNNIDKKDYDAVPQEFKNMIEKNMNKEYKFEVHSDEDFEKQELLQETKAILAYLYLNYWGTEKEKMFIKEKFKQDIIKTENEKRLKYPTDKIFDTTDQSRSYNTTENHIIEYKKESLLKKLINRIKKFFGK